MKLTIDRADLFSLTNSAQNIVEKRNAMHILVNVLLEAEGQTLKVFATDLEVSLTGQAKAKVTEGGRAAVSAKSLFEIVKELPEGPIQLEKKENNWLKLTQHKSVFNIVGMSPEEYPVFPTFSTQDFMKIESEVMREMIEKTIYSVSSDLTRYHLNGVFFEKQKVADGIAYRMVATDGHRLSLVDRKTDSTGFSTTNQGVIIPRKGLYEIRKLLEVGDGVVEIAIEGAQLIVKFQDSILMVRLIEGRYPNYQQLIPQNLKEQLTVQRESLLASLKRVSLLSNQKSKGVTLNITQGKMEITSNNPELGDAKEEIEIDYRGREMRIGFNAKYILDVLSSMNEDVVQIELNDQLSPGLVRPKNDRSYTCVVMPMRI